MRMENFWRHAGSAAVLSLAATRATKDVGTRLKSQGRLRRQLACVTSATCNDTLCNGKEVLQKMWGTADAVDKMFRYVEEHSRVPQVLRDLAAVTEREVPRAFMATTIDQLPLLSMLTHVSQAKCIVDIGTFTGISALQFALATDKDGHVITIDRDDKNLDLATKHWKKAGVSHKIKPRIGDAIDIIKQLKKEGYSGKVDLAFVDADKISYDRYYEELLTMVRPNGLILIDNTLWFGQVADENSTDKVTASLRRLNKKMLNDKRIRFVMLMSGDGLNVCQVLPQ